MSEAQDNWYVLNLNPVPWKVGPAGVSRGNGGKLKAYVGRDQELRTYQDAIREQLKLMNPVKIIGKFCMTIYFWRQIETYATEKTAKARNQEADATNLYKSTEDACQKILFDNDRDNLSQRGVIIDQSPSTTGKIVIHIWSAPGDIETDMMDIMPDDIYSKVYGRDGEQLELALSGVNTELAREDDKYAASGDDF